MGIGKQKKHPFARGIVFQQRDQVFEQILGLLVIARTVVLHRFGQAQLRIRIAPDRFEGVVATDQQDRCTTCQTNEEDFFHKGLQR